MAASLTKTLSVSYNMSSTPVQLLPFQPKYTFSDMIFITSIINKQHIEYTNFKPFLFFVFPFKTNSWTKRLGKPYIVLVNSYSAY